MAMKIIHMIKKRVLSKVLTRCQKLWPNLWERHVTCDISHLYFSQIKTACTTVSVFSRLKGHSNRYWLLTAVTASADSRCSFSRKMPSRSDSGWMKVAAAQQIWLLPRSVCRLTSPKSKLSRDTEFPGKNERERNRNRFRSANSRPEDKCHVDPAVMNTFIAWPVLCAAFM